MAVKQALGTQVSITTVQQEVVTGTLYALDDTVEVLALRQPNSNSQTTDPGVFDLRWIKYSHIESCETQPGPKGDLGRVGYIDPKELEAKQQKALKAIDLSVKSHNPAVSEQVQHLFSQLAVANKCVWKGESIVMFDKVEVPPPYTPDSCKALTKNAGDTLKRVKELLPTFRQRVGLGN
eukprot:m.118720 g.118720  ORF g.118720 m.118720 type:complete len:179 (-) comp15572_c0_seq2:408-944(-)